MKTVFYSLLILFASQLNAYACKCVIPGPDFEEAYKKADYVFIGQCVKAEFIKLNGSNPDSSYVVRYTFDIQQAWKGIMKQEILAVDTGIGFGDCGFQFDLGLSYIIYGYAEDNTIYTNICARTRLAGFYPNRIEEKAKDEISRLDSILKN